MQHPDHAIAEIIVHPLTQRLEQPTQTSWGRYDAVSILVVEVRTSSGLTGFGEALARFAPNAYAALVTDALAPPLIGADALAIGANWSRMRRALSGRAGGMLIEAIAAIDIALWDIVGKAAGLPIWRLLGGMGRKAVPVYAASINWGDDAAADAAVDDFIGRGFDRIKIKIGGPHQEAIRRIERVRQRAGDAVELTADANWAYRLDAAIEVGRALAAQGYAWFEEPLRPEDEGGYAELQRRCAVPLAAGESNYTLDQARGQIERRELSFLQPNITRAGGLSETRRMAEHARAHDVAYAPHVGMSGIICEVASLHLAAAQANTAVVECACPPNRFKEGLADLAPGYQRARNGMLEVPQGPGLGISIDRHALAALRA